MKSSLSKGRARRSAADNPKFRQWCIEMAIRWPVEHAHSPGRDVSPVHHTGYVHRDEDVLDRAKKIATWVLEGKKL